MRMPDALLSMGRPHDSRAAEPASDATRPDAASLRFRRYRVEPRARRLIRDGHELALGSRAFDLLLALLRARGQVVSKSEITRQVWPDTLVDESNLRFQIGALRHALGEDRDLIKTIPGRGYLFVSQVDPAEPIPVGPETSCSPLPDPDGRTLADRDRAVAIIEDDPETREALEGLLQSAGMQVDSYVSVQAYTQNRSSPPSCLVLDVLLPGQSGLDFQAELNRSGVRMPIIFISGHADVHMGVEAMKAGAFDFLTKPVRYRDLLTAITLALSETDPRHVRSLHQNINPPYES